jgi:hypothetical protein
MRILSILILFSFLCATGISAEIKAAFNLINETKILNEGDLVEGVLKVWPIENADLNEFRKLQNVLFFNNLLLLQLHSVEVSPNNADLVEIKGTFVVKPTKALSTFDINYKGQLITVPAIDIQIKALDQKGKTYFILDQSLNYSHSQIFIIFALVLFLLVFVYFKKDYLINKIKSLKLDPVAKMQKKYQNIFSIATNRRDYEEIYATRREWMALIKEPSPAYRDFFKTMNQHQYKKEWSPNDLNEVKESFLAIRGSFR